MNCNVTQNRPRAAAFTLIEMIGVLAVIAILAALLVPKVFSAINDARINSVCINCDTIKTAVADHYGKYGKMDWIFGTNQIPSSQFASGVCAGYDTNVLMAEGLIDKPFVAKIAGGDPQTTSNIQLANGGSENGTAAGYQLDGVTNRTAGAQFVVEARLDQVTAADAKELNDRIDGTALGAPFGQADNKGRVEYAQPVNGTTTVYVYLTHR